MYTISWSQRSPWSEPMYTFESLGITDGAQLRTIALQMGFELQYIGFAEDMRELPNGVSIINIGGHQGGTHWTMLWADQHEVLYADSYATGPEDQIISLAHGRPLYYNNLQVQRYEEEHCGVWALLAGRAIMKRGNTSPVDALDAFLSRYQPV